MDYFFKEVMLFSVFTLFFEFRFVSVSKLLVPNEDGKTSQVV